MGADLGAGESIRYEAVEHALDECFDAIFAPAQWQSAMDALAASFGALGCCLNPNSRVFADRFCLPSSGRYRDMLTEFVHGNWKPLDLRHLRGWKLAIGGKPLIFENDCSSAEERRSLPIYNELFARHELQNFVGVRLVSGGETWSFNLVRSEAMGGFERDANAILKARPSLNRLLKVAHQVASVSARSAITAFERAALGAILLDNAGRVMEVNLTAQGLMGHGLDVHHHHLSARSASDNGALQTLIHATINGGAFAAAGGDPVYISREGAAPLIVEAVDMHNARAEIFGFNGALLLITDPRARRRPRLEILRRAFSLTLQEANVGQLLSAGMDSREIAALLRLRLSSVQQLIKSLLTKTGTGRQSALIALFARLPGDGTDTAAP